MKEDEEFYVTAEIKDSQVRFQLDSGAKPNVMSAKVYRASKQTLRLTPRGKSNSRDAGTREQRRCKTSPWICAVLDPVPAKPVK